MEKFRIIKFLIMFLLFLLAISTGSGLRDYVTNDCMCYYSVAGCSDNPYGRTSPGSLVSDCSGCIESELCCCRPCPAEESGCGSTAQCNPGTRCTNYVCAAGGRCCPNTRPNWDGSNCVATITEECDHTTDICCDSDDMYTDNNQDPDNDCGTCRVCDGFGVCKNANSGTDVKNQCSTALCGTGNCASGGVCGAYDDGLEHNCGAACKWCTDLDVACEDLNNQQDTSGANRCEGFCQACDWGVCRSADSGTDPGNDCVASTTCTTGTCTYSGASGLCGAGGVCQLPTGGNVPSNQVCGNSNDFIDATSAISCAAAVPNCVAGSCSGSIRYPECTGTGICDAAATTYYQASATIYATGGNSFTAACGVTASPCDSTPRASPGPGDNNYGIGGAQLCQGFCDGNNNCDWAGNCGAADECSSGDCCDTSVSPHKFRLNTYVCRASTGVCDPAERCTGSSSTCPGNSFAPITTVCDASTRCSSGAGNGNYGAGGRYSCIGYCDGGGVCDYADGCNDCGVGTCTDTGNSWVVQESITISGGCAGGSCVVSSTLPDSCAVGNVVHDLTCSGGSQGADLTYDCDNYDTNNCWCTPAGSTLTKSCDDWDCNTGRCRDSGADFVNNSWACGATNDCSPLQPCGSSNYVCYRTNSGSWNWALSAEVSETACADGYNNDCGVAEWDYDNMDRGVGSAAPHGDNDCLVGVSGITPPASAVVPGANFQLLCARTTPVEVNSIKARIDSPLAGCSFRNWVGVGVGAQANFTCTAPATPGTYTVRCFVDLSQSYQSGIDRTASITVGGASMCSSYNQAQCVLDSSCEWCGDCFGVFYKGSLAECKVAGSCNYPAYYCDRNPADLTVPYDHCNAECDANDAGCPNTCTGDIRNFRSCDTTGTCRCQTVATQDCNIFNCTTGLACQGVGSSVIRQVGDDYTCSGSGNCVVSLPPLVASCGGPWTCNAAGACLPPQSCGGSNYVCYRTNSGSWNWGLNAEAVETNCSDGFDNDCDGSSDCTDSDCGCVCPDCPCAEICNDNLDNDCDLKYDGCDNDLGDCQEGDGPPAGALYRCCNNGVDGDGDTFMDLDDPGCCDLVTPPRGFSDTGDDVSGVGVDCGGLVFKFERLIPQMKEHCCGAGEGNSEFFITTVIGSNTYYGCCDNAGDCVDSDGDCQIGVENTYELCTDEYDNDCDGDVGVADDNCSGTLQGHVFDERRYPLSKATVKGSPPALGAEYEEVSEPTTFEGDGFYSMKPFIGTYDFIARKEGYDDNVTRITIQSGVTTNQDFYLRNGSCHADCTDGYGNCNPACNGIVFTDASGGSDTCNFVTLNCSYRPKGFKYKETYTDEHYYDMQTHTYGSRDMIREYTCCEVTEGATVTYPSINPRLSGDFDNLYDYVTNVMFGGRYVRLHIAVASPRK
ncbi:MAG TPA: hypothetical protein VJ461_04210 [Candidatus Nanoarchaeia archaeon]|nr:hypothetical protein [Candidatus Nanoarchaeia archaeon]